MYGKSLLYLAILLFMSMIAPAPSITWNTNDNISGESIIIKLLITISHIHHYCVPGDLVTSFLNEGFSFEKASRVMLNECHHLQLLLQVYTLWSYDLLFQLNLPFCKLLVNLDLCKGRLYGATKTKILKFLYHNLSYCGDCEKECWHHSQIFSQPIIP